jgi:ribonuclease VapC
MAYDLIVDTSAVVAVVLEEGSAERIIGRLMQSRAAAIPGPTFLEAGIVLASRLGRDPSADILELFGAAGVSISPVGSGEAPAALKAFLQYGKGRHPAKLNYGDCMVYATAKLHAAPVLSVGNDFAQTDVELA